MSKHRFRLLYLVGGFQIGGTERHLSFVLPRLNRTFLEIRVRLLGPDGPLRGPLDDAGMDVARIEGKACLEVPKIRAIYGICSKIVATAQEINRFKPDIVHCYLPEPSSIGWLATRFASACCFLVISKRSQIIRPEAFPGEKWLERRALRSADYVLGNSKAVAAELRDLGISPERIYLIHNGIPLEPFSEPVNSLEFRAKEGWPEDAVIFAVLANLIPYKGHEDLFRALRHLKRKGPDWKVVLIGSYPNQRMEFLRQLTRQWSLDDRVIFLGERSDVPAILASSDVGVLTSHHEGFSNAILEYMAAGLPVIATDVGGNRDAVVHGETGILVPASSPRALSEAIGRILVDPKLRLNMGENGKRRVRKYFSLERCVDAYERFYDSILRN
ncbi:MAG: glycosyltransferase [Deltaproteobacteria bacterium]|nr:glycosyltransferase [Deltaproteobacteria bacterium]